MPTPDETRLQDIRGIGPKRFNNIMTRLAETGQDLNDLFKMPATEIREKFKLPQSVAEAIATASEARVKQLETDLLTGKGIRVLKRGSQNYPKCLEEVLGEKAPSVLYVWGNLDLLNKPAIGFCGSRAVTEKGIEVTADTARQVVDLGWVVVSGHARGVDTTAHRIALENNGSTIIVAPEGILKFRLRQELKNIAKQGQLLILSEFPPEAPWSVRNAMTRNKTIIGLSDAMILVEARLEGGTFEAGKAALRYKVPLYVAHYQTPGQSAAGNEYFIQRGAARLLKSPDTGKANITHLRATIHQKNAETTVAPAREVSGKKPEQLLLLLDPE